MSYDLKWHTPQRTLQLTLSGYVTLEEFRQLDRAIHDMIGTPTQPLAMIIDTSAVASVSVYTEQIRASQTFPNHPKMEWILIIGQNKLMRFTMMVIYNASQARLQFFQTHAEVMQFVNLFARA